MYLWRKLVTPRWFSKHEDQLRSRTGSGLVVIKRPLRKKLMLEVADKSGAKALALRRDFGGQFEKLRPDWSKRFARETLTPSLHIGRRLVIMNAEGSSGSRVRVGRGLSRHQGRSHIVIPASAAFGTGGHVTTAMSLRLLEEITRSRKDRWALADLGTGSGIFALAARVFGAQHVYAIDSDPVAIRIARENARRNNIRGIEFEVADVTKWLVPAKVDVAMANLFSEILIKILPRMKAALRRDGWLILSGILRGQEIEVRRALTSNGTQILKTRRHGRWTAILARMAQAPRLRSK